jgi:hypothetical protein
MNLPVQEQDCMMQPTANMTVEDIVHGMSFWLFVHHSNGYLSFK